ncbi:Txe/YoeB family addiction module toxin [Paraburkholderia tropica]|uniref:Txe/YoeB family addiction module toxin n=1 Tax=Paraburkholderia tropica TaxID=92647 RepID=UPI002AB13077|nr:Txe/YoeB family addiction module toxin [Paraburkholderia tropica]
MSQQKKARNKHKAASGVKVAWSDHGWDDYLHWQTTDMAIARDINRLIEEIARDPFRGIGKPGPLKGALSGFWSRRITRVDRLVYIVKEGVIYVMQCRYHYER